MTISLYDIPVQRIDGTSASLAEYRGKTLLIVNTASKCGFTPQYEGLNQLHRDFRDRGLVVLGFPCNQFGGQEPGTEDEIKQFCDTRYRIEFPMFSKIDVNGRNEHPLYKLLKSEAPGILGTEAIKWNFTKFLVNADGKVLKRFAPTDTPESIRVDIESALPSHNRAQAAPEGRA
jgi:glutathione peroxidase